MIVNVIRLKDAPAMKRLRRFSIRSALMLIAVFAVFFAYQTNAARQQRRDVAIIRDAGGTVYYDWMLQPIYDTDGSIPYFKILNDPESIDAPRWLRKSLGDEYFQQVAKVHVPANTVDDTVLEAISNLPELTDISLLPNSTDKPPLTEAEIGGLRERLTHASGVQVGGPFGSF